MSPSIDSHISSHGVNGNSNGVNGHAGGLDREPAPSSPPSVLKTTSTEELHDLICVGFGPASLAIGIALHDAIDPISGLLSKGQGGSGQPPKVHFLERQTQFAWHAGMLLPGSKMQISFIKDLATLRNPRSEFTFLNYLHSHGRLVQFSNLGTFLPARLEFEDYMKWCAQSFNDVVSYGQEAFSIVPEQGKSRSQKADSFLVHSRNTKTGKITTRRSRHVVIAVGGKARIPHPFPEDDPKVLHSSTYCTSVPKVLKDPMKSYHIAVVGSGQSAAEIFHNLQNRFPNSKTKLIIRDTALRPSDDSPFVNEVFDPARVDTFYHQPPEVRDQAIASDRATNYGVVRLDLLEQIYQDLYLQKVRNPYEEEWPHNLLRCRTVTSVQRHPQLSKVRLVMRNHDFQHVPDATNHTLEEHLDVDLVIVATGYARDAHEDILKDVESLAPASSRFGTGWKIDRNYQVVLNKDLVSDNAGIWLQGCNESTHGLSDSLLSILATRGGEVVDSIFRWH